MLLGSTRRIVALIPNTLEILLLIRFFKASSTFTSSDQNCSSISTLISRESRLFHDLQSVDSAVKFQPVPEALTPLAKEIHSPPELSAYRPSAQDIFPCGPRCVRMHIFPHVTGSSRVCDIAAKASLLW